MQDTKVCSVSCGDKCLIAFLFKAAKNPTIVIKDDDRFSCFAFDTFDESRFELFAKIRAIVIGWYVFLSVSCFTPDGDHLPRTSR